MLAAAALRAASISAASAATVAGAEKGEIGPDLFRAACSMGLEGLVSKRADRRYRGGRSKDWIKIKNRKHPAKAGTVAAFVYAADGS